MTGPWRLADLRGRPKNGLKVFSCFHGGGGSSMGYKLAGFDVLGGVEIDPDMMDVYCRNLTPELSYLMRVQDFKHRDLPAELYDLDVLDGSPPCSSFSMAGARERDWGKEKHFREGQVEQVLDDLFFHFIDVAAWMKPRVVVAENVRGLIMGAARGYVREIYSRFHAAGYDVQLFLLNAQHMGVPQRRERTFFLARRRDLALPKFALDFREPIIPLHRALKDCITQDAHALPPSLEADWHRIKKTGRGRYTSTSIAWPDRPSPTLTSKVTTAEGSVMAYDRPRKLSAHEVARISSFPEDYDFDGMDPGYVCGMSVPPLMMQRVASRVADVLSSSRGEARS